MDDKFVETVIGRADEARMSWMAKDVLETMAVYADDTGYSADCAKTKSIAKCAFRRTSDTRWALETLLVAGLVGRRRVDGKLVWVITVGTTEAT